MSKKNLKARYDKAMESDDISKALETGAEYLKSISDDDWMNIQEKVFPKHIKSTEEDLRTMDREGLIAKLKGRASTSKSSPKSSKDYVSSKNMASSVSNLFIPTSEWQENVAQKAWDGWSDAFYKENDEDSEQAEVFEKLKEEIEKNGWVGSFIRSMYSVYDFGEKYHNLLVWEDEHKTDIRIARMEDYLTGKTDEDWRTYEPSRKAKPNKITNKKRKKEE